MMKVPYVLLAIYVVIFTNGLIDDVNASRSNAGTFFSPRHTKIHGDTILKMLEELPVTECVLSCKISTRCHQAAMRGRECVHLRKANDVKEISTVVEVNILTDTSPGLFILVIGISFYKKHDCN